MFQDKKTVPNNLQMLEFDTITIKVCNQKLKGTYKKLLPLDDNEQVCATAPNGKGGCYVSALVALCTQLDAYPACAKHATRSTNHVNDLLFAG